MQIEYVCVPCSRIACRRVLCPGWVQDSKNGIRATGERGESGGRGICSLGAFCVCGGRGDGEGTDNSRETSPDPVSFHGFRVLRNTLGDGLVKTFGACGCLPLQLHSTTHEYGQ